jgi:hypothetical protein
MMIGGSCDCGQVRWRFKGVPAHATACNCTLCRRYGVLWAYDFEAEKIEVEGETRAYTRGPKRTAFHFCPECGCVAYWRRVTPNEDGRRRMAVNLRLAEPDDVGAIPLKHLDGLGPFEHVPRATQCVADIWF